MATNSLNKSTDEGELPSAVVEDILDSERRRVMLSTLADRGGAMVVDDLAAAVRAAEEGETREVVERDACQEIRTDIYERHLPKLMATGVVEYDSMREAVHLVDDSLVKQQ